MLKWYRDDNRDRLRVMFLSRVITASMDLIHQETMDSDLLNSTESIQWMSRCQTVAFTWKINDDELRIHQVCNLYTKGFDRLAEEVGPVNVIIIDRTKFRRMEKVHISYLAVLNRSLQQ